MTEQGSERSTFTVASLAQQGVPRVGEQMPDGTVRVVSPPFVYLPCRVDEQGELAEIMMVKLRDGRTALMAYSALDRFVRACGDRHPWVVYDTSLLEELRHLKPYDAAYLDVTLPEELRVTGEPS